MGNFWISSGSGFLFTCSVYFRVLFWLTARAQGYAVLAFHVFTPADQNEPNRTGRPELWQNQTRFIWLLINPGTNHYSR